MTLQSRAERTAAQRARRAALPPKSERAALIRANRGLLPAASALDSALNGLLQSIRARQPNNDHQLPVAISFDGSAWTVDVQIRHRPSGIDYEISSEKPTLTAALREATHTINNNQNIARLIARHTELGPREGPTENYDRTYHSED